MRQDFITSFSTVIEMAVHENARYEAKKNIANDYSVIIHIYKTDQQRERKIEILIKSRGEIQMSYDPKTVLNIPDRGKAYNEKYAKRDGMHFCYYGQKTLEEFKEDLHNL